MQFEKPISIEIAQRRTGLVIYAKQDDNESRFYRVTFTDNGQEVDISGATSAIFRGEKPDGHSFALAGTLNGDGTITIEVGGQVLTSPGYVECDVAAMKGSKVLSAGNFNIKVERVPLGEDTTDSEDDFSFINVASRAAETANAAAKNATDSAAAAVADANAAAEGAREATTLIEQIVENYLYIDAEGYICAEGGN